MGKNLIVAALPRLSNTDINTGPPRHITQVDRRALRPRIPYVNKAYARSIKSRFFSADVCDMAFC